MTTTAKPVKLDARSASETLARMNAIVEMVETNVSTSKSTTTCFQRKMAKDLRATSYAGGQWTCCNRKFLSIGNRKNICV